MKTNQKSNIFSKMHLANTWEVFINELLSVPPPPFVVLSLMERTTKVVGCSGAEFSLLLAPKKRV